MIKIKVCGIAGDEFIKKAESLRIDYLGFIFYTGSKRYLMNNLYNDIIKDIPKRIKKVGVFVNAGISEILKTKKDYQLDFVQLHGDENTEFVEKLSKHIQIIKAFRIDADFQFSQLADYEPFCHYFLFDTKTENYGGSGKKFNWKILQHYNSSVPFFLSGGIQASDIKSIKQFYHPKFHGIDINSGFEIKPGIKDIKLIQEFINQLK